MDLLSTMGCEPDFQGFNMIHLCVATNQRPLKRQGLYCYLDLKVAIGELGLKVMYSKTAQIVLVEDRVPPEALCLTWKSPAELGLQGLTFAPSASCFWTSDFFACDHCRG